MITLDQKKQAAKILGVKFEDLDAKIDEKIKHLMDTKVAKWKSQGKTKITKATFNKEVNKMLKQVLAELGL